MKKTGVSLLILATAGSLSACSTLKGAGIAAASGGDVATGAAVGGGAGTVAGTVIDH
ncbi:hypothetical protein [Novosphingopyxis sp. YJ-S2-01]|uniref:hypothetical protein n=1 Tax=Novosphingopyxis sp. YJ-S2-01 TaxID=2794021 RepID=UPI0018DEC62B|nr:hypothetical protein [Novosphingopyxis sp. YJ-S2-01]MBH9537573.1 hypothetical protein [Novosphingopyxis sp. YJ-S2-01]